MANLLEHDDHPAHPSRLRGEKWVRECQKPQLTASVPDQVVLLFEAARGSMIYGLFFLPLVALATEESFRVLESGVRYRCQQLGIVKRRPGKAPALSDKPYSDLVSALHKAGQIPEKDLDMWRSMVFLRNRFSHRTSVAIRDRDGSVAQLSSVAELLNRLFK